MTATDVEEASGLKGGGGTMSDDESPIRVPSITWQERVTGHAHYEPPRYVPKGAASRSAVISCTRGFMSDDQSSLTWRIRMTAQKLKKSVANLLGNCIHTRLVSFATDPFRSFRFQTITMQHTANEFLCSDIDIEILRLHGLGFTEWSVGGIPDP